MLGNMRLKSKMTLEMIGKKITLKDLARDIQEAGFNSIRCDEVTSHKARQEALLWFLVTRSLTS